MARVDFAVFKNTREAGWIQLRFGGRGVGKPCILWLFGVIWVRSVKRAGGCCLFGLWIENGFVWRFWPQGL